ncbi:MAG: hypothetical protein E5W81_00545 [Mesorhizobium sp.]|nr:MAG: hypothetical protein E5V36_02950 [Mesorhizobium sp.]TKC02205.1 MAG: hypothetical protein E5W81_00545 [Mesorhizobium sp.]
MEFFTFMIIFVVGGTFLVLAMSFAWGNAVIAELDAKLRRIPDFTPMISYKSPTEQNGIALDLGREKIAIIPNRLTQRQHALEPLVYPFSDLIAVEVVRDGLSVVKTKRGSQLAGAAIGGVLLGPAGIIVGGLSGAKRQENKIEKLSLKLYTNHLVLPVQELVFCDLPRVGIDPKRAEHVIGELDQWYGRLRAIVERQNRVRN